MAKLLLEIADPNAARTDTGATALFMASHHGHVEARLLLQQNAEPNATRTGDGATALFMASQNGHMKVAQLLLEHSANANTADTDDACTALIMASAGGYIREAQLLAVHGAALGHVDDDGDTAQQATAGQGHDQLADWQTGSLPLLTTRPSGSRSALRMGALGRPTTVRAERGHAHRHRHWAVGCRSRNATRVQGYHAVRPRRHGVLVPRTALALPWPVPQSCPHGAARAGAAGQARGH